MKKIFTSLFTLVFVGGLSLFAQAPRTVLIEEFTSATCPPCAATNPIFQKFLEQFGNKVVNVAFQCQIPSTGDPMYASNTADVNTRETYYGINSAPNCRVDGKIAAGTNPHPILVTADYINDRLSNLSPIEIKVDHVVIFGTGGAKDSMQITVDIKNVSSTDFSNANYVLQTSIVEDLIKFPKQAATNGETEFHVVMRKMLPSAAGTKITDVIAPGQTKTVNYKVAVPTYIYSYNQLGVVAWVQDNTASSKEVIQAGVSEPKPLNGLYYDLAMVNGNITGRVDNCDNTVGFECTVQNLSTNLDTIKTIDFIPVVGGANKTKSTWTGVLLPGGTITHKIGNQTIPVGNSSINVYIDKINGGAFKDLNIVNNFQSQTVLTTFNSSVFGTSIDQNFELPIGNGAPSHAFFLNEGIRIFKIDSSIFAYNGTNPPVGVGGFGNSRYSLLFYFMDGGVAGLSSSVIFDKIDLSASKQTKLKWSYAYTTKTQDDFDKMEVLVSKDCGSTWVSVYEKQGIDMQSCEPDPSRFNYPGIYNAYPEDWKIEEVDLSAYDGTPELMVRFKGTGGNGQGYFLDDINLTSSTLVDNPGILNSISIAPNPTTEVINIKIQSEAYSQATISLTDLNGRKLSSYNKEIITGDNQITIPAEVHSGVYLVEVKTKNGVKFQKVTIIN